jgi:enoyl-CoA hydratase
VLHLNRPRQRNALSAALRQAIVDSLDELEADATVKSVVLGGLGETFCAGFDLKELSEGDAAEIFHEATAYHHTIHTFPKPIVAAVNGPALAGGMDLASMCDLRLAVRGARFGQPQVKLGIPAAYELTRSFMSESMARRLCLTGDQISAEEALAAGYVSAIFDDVEALNSAALDWASRIAVAAGSGAMKRQFVTVQPELFALTT